MEVNAKIANRGRQIRIMKMGTGHTSLMTLTDAMRCYGEGRIHKTNKCFDRLVAHNFDVKATLTWYFEERKRMAKDKVRAGTSATDET